VNLGRTPGLAAGGEKVIDAEFEQGAIRAGDRSGV